jgi:predicted SnoaL-like aldol condensation-catalyzing enzyme
VASHREDIMNQKLANATALYMEGNRDGRVREAIEAYTEDRYTQHSSGVADGVEGCVAFFEPFIERTPVRDIRVVCSIVDGNFVFRTGLPGSQQRRSAVAHN